MKDRSKTPASARGFHRLSTLLLLLVAVTCVYVCTHPLLRRKARAWNMRRAERIALRSIVDRVGLPAGVIQQGRKLVRQQDGAEMALIPSGEFLMGSDGEADERPVRRVYLDAYLIDRYEVTNEQYTRFMEACPEWASHGERGRACKPLYLKHWQGGECPAGHAQHPVHQVPWEAARAYAQWAQAYLPTEAQWEKAARGGLESKQFPWGDQTDPNLANWGFPQWPHLRPGNPFTLESATGARFEDLGVRPVGSFPPNGYGLYDMAGNVWEWCADWYHLRYYETAPTRNPAGPSCAIVFPFLDFGFQICSRALRGGSCYRRPELCRCANRSYDHLVEQVADKTDYYYGFRCVVNLTQLPGSPDAHQRRDRPGAVRGHSQVVGSFAWPGAI